MEERKEPIIESQKTTAEISELLKNNTIDQVVIHGGKTTTNEREQKEEWTELHPDLDARMALYLLNENNKKKPEEIYEERAMTSVIPKTGSTENLAEKKGIRIFIDVGGNWLKVEKGKETTTIHIDHHGPGQKEPTSATKMMYEIMDKADLLKEKPEWLGKFVNFINEFDNLTYLDKTDEKDKKIFDEDYFKRNWPYTLYALAEKIPFETLLELCKSGKIKDLSKPLTSIQLDGEIGKIKTKDGKSILEECETQKNKASETVDGIRTAIWYATKRRGLNLDTGSLGKIIYHDFPVIKKKGEEKKFINKIPNDTAFIGTKALGFDTFVSWNKRKGKFFINSNSANLSGIVEKLNQIDPGSAVDVRGVMLFGKIKNLTEKKLLNAIDPGIFKNTGKNETEKTAVEQNAENKEEWTKENEKLLGDVVEKIKRIEKRLKEIDEEEKLEEDKKKDSAENETVIENKGDIESFDTKYLEKRVRELLEPIKEIKNIKVIKITGYGDELVLYANVTAGKFLVSIDISINSISIVNQGNSIGFEKNYLSKITATRAEETVKDKISENIDSIGVKLMELISVEKNKAVEKIWIEDGQLKVMYRGNK